MKVNGKEILLNKCKSLKDYLLENNYDISKVAVELDGHIIKRATYEEVTLNENSCLEIVCFVGGG